MADLSPAQFLIAFAIAATAGTLVFFHAERNQHPASVGVGRLRVSLSHRRPARPISCTSVASGAHGRSPSAVSSATGHRRSRDREPSRRSSRRPSCSRFFVWAGAEGWRVRPRGPEAPGHPPPHAALTLLAGGVSRGRGSTSRWPTRRCRAEALSRAQASASSTVLPDPDRQQRSRSVLRTSHAGCTCPTAGAEVGSRSTRVSWRLLSRLHPACPAASRRRPRERIAVVH